MKSLERGFFIPSSGHHKFSYTWDRLEIFLGRDLEPIFSRRARELLCQLRLIRQSFLCEHNAQIFHDRHHHLLVECLLSPTHQ